MAEIKKTAQAKATEDKVEAVAAVKEPVVAEEAEKNVEAKEEEKPAAKKRTTRKTSEKKDTKDAAEKKASGEKKTAVKKTADKKEAEDKKETKTRTRRSSKTAAKAVISLQFSGKSYGMEDLQKMAEDVWKYDLQKDGEAFQTLELYVKPEENTVYYVFDGEIMGSFQI